MRWLARKPAETASTVTSAAAARALPHSDFVCIDRNAHAFQQHSCSKSKVGADACLKIAHVFQQHSCPKSGVGADA
ncbi:hypothetical protein [Choristoneura diversana nucleopolyhedrovirus]|nr:hypothetical protein [Choristoneura diversana nucleopolyhedrovirus]